MNCTFPVEHAAIAAVEAHQTLSQATPCTNQDTPQVLSLELLRHVAGGGPGGSWSEAPGGSW